MSNSRMSSALFDQIGIWASVLCAIHCIATPVLLSASVVFAHFIPGEESTHRTLAVGIALVGGIALVRGFRVHGRKRIIGLMAIGLLCIFAGAYFGDKLPNHGWEVAITVVGSVFMVVSHRLNHTFCHDCDRCVPTDLSSVEKTLNKSLPLG